ncbi:Rrp9 [Symbiodinium microadriaticum]|nr:Rrp9 [Symbiodinium microadriaticum]
MQSHSGEVLCVAVSSDGKYIAAGGRDKLVRVFDKRTLTEVKALSGHRDAVTCLAFRRDSSSLYSGSLDRCIKHWDMNEMGYLETLFGHQDGVTAMDCWLKEKPVTSSVDRTVRVWKVAEESHLVFRGHKCCVDNVQYLTADHYASSGQDGSLCMWTDTQKKPVASVAAAHGMESPGTPRWISAMASLKISDLLVTGSHDGHLRFWKADTEKRSVDAMAQWRTNDCFINGIAVSSRLVVVGTGSEHRLGRWWRVKGAKNRVEIFKLPDSIAEASSYKAETLSASSSESDESDGSGDYEEDN